MSNVTLEIVNRSVTINLGGSGGGGAVNGIPAGGAANEILAKTSGVDYAVAWRTLQQLAATLPEYASNEAAISGGDRLYRADNTHDGAYPGTIIYAP